MKNILLILTLLSLTAAHSQSVISEIIVDEDFNDLQVHPNLDYEAGFEYVQIATGNPNWTSPFWEFKIDGNEQRSDTYTMVGIDETLLSQYDSIKVELDLVDPYLEYGTIGHAVGFNFQHEEIFDYFNLQVTYSLFGLLYQDWNSGTHSNGSLLGASKVFETIPTDGVLFAPFLQQELKLYDSDTQELQEEFNPFGDNYETYVADFCWEKTDGIQSDYEDCQAALQNPDAGITLGIDNLKITGYKAPVTALDFELAKTQEVQVENMYNCLGQKIGRANQGEIVIYQMSDGSVRREVFLGQ